MSLDMYAIGTAVAGKFASVTAPTGTMGGTAIRGATVETPNNIPATPYVVVELPSGEVTQQASRRDGVHTFTTYFLFQKASGDLARDKKAMLKWLVPLLNAFNTGSKLGITEVMKTLITGYDYDTGGYQYAGDVYHGWQFTVTVWTQDGVTITP